jgi:uncharacterized protein (DUF433 family)
VLGEVYIVWGMAHPRNAPVKILGVAERGLVRHRWHMAELLDRLTFNPKQCGGRPCLRGMRIRVSDVLDLFAAGLTAVQILDEMSDLEAEDLKACLSFASRHPLLAG